MLQHVPEVLGKTGRVGSFGTGIVDDGLGGEVQAEHGTYPHKL